MCRNQQYKQRSGQGACEIAPEITALNNTIEKDDFLKKIQLGTLRVDVAYITRLPKFAQYTLGRSIQSRIWMLVVVLSY